MFDLIILGRKCMLAASRAAPGESRRVYADGTDRETDGRTDTRPLQCAFY